MSDSSLQSGLTPAAVMQALRTVQEPELHQDLVTLNMIRDLTVHGGEVGFTIVLTTPACPLRARMEQEATAAVQALGGVTQVTVRFTADVRQDHRIIGKLNIPVKNIVAVASGKGGVGKSTVSTNLAVSLTLDGAKVGVLDADIYGPNIPMMFGLSGRPRIDNNKMIPFERYGVEVISMGFLMPEGEAVVWRGPMLHKAIHRGCSTQPGAERSTHRRDHCDRATGGGGQRCAARGPRLRTAGGPDPRGGGEHVR